MTDAPKRHCIPDPYPETIGVTALTIWVPEDFRGDAEIIWWYPGKSSDEDKQRITCNANALLQGIFRDVRGARPGEPVREARGRRDLGVCMMNLSIWMRCERMFHAIVAGSGERLPT